MSAKIISHSEFMARKYKKFGFVEDSGRVNNNPDFPLRTGIFADNFLIDIINGKIQPSKEEVQERVKRRFEDPGFSPGQK